MQSQSKQVIIFTDGACRGNPGPGGWGAVLYYNQHKKYLKGAEILTTNNRMELTAVINAIKTLKQSCLIKITTDSKYVKNGITVWMDKWKRNGWMTSNKKPIKNLDLWQELARIASSHQINWFWIKGHSNHSENDLADELANKAIDELV
ncbi:MAG: ribonuclease HI [Coxiellaceae bacterium]|jgi:ribonuclease HI|nr:ribonuclease HI [Coxiellaceae bacterium]